MNTFDLDLLKPMFEVMPDVVIAMKYERDSCYKYLYANKAAYQLGGVTTAFIGQRIEDVHSAEYSQILISHYNDAMSLKHPVTFEHKPPYLERNINKVSAVPLVDFDGLCQFIIVIAKDISTEQKLLDKLKTENEMFETLFMQSPDSIVVLDTSGRVKMSNHQYQLTHGWEHEELITFPTIPSIPESRKNEAIDLYHKCMSGDYITSFHTERVSKSGQIFDVSLNLAPIRNRFSEITGIIVSERNISEQLEQRRFIQESEERYRLIADNVTDLVCVMDPNGVVQYASPSYDRILGVAPSWYEGQQGRVVVHDKDVEKVVSAFSRSVRLKQIITVEYQKKRLRTNDHLYMESSFTPVVVDAQVERVICVSRDITQRQKAKKRLEHLAYYDSLTDLPNRRFFLQRLNAMTQEILNEQFAVLFLDCDNFKAVNDNLGHDTGDAVLNFLARTLLDCTDCDDTVARFAGDEFAIILPEIKNRASAVQIASYIVEALRPPLKFGEHIISVSMSIGISFYPDHTHAHGLLKSADDAMYIAKQAGGNRWQVDPH